MGSLYFNFWKAKRFCVLLPLVWAGAMTWALTIAGVSHLGRGVAFLPLVVFLSWARTDTRIRLVASNRATARNRYFFIEINLQTMGLPSPRVAERLTGGSVGSRQRTR